MVPVQLQFLKLGGSLITDKSRPRSPRMEVIQRLAGEIASACQQNPNMRLMVGHGSGSFGHTPAQKYGTRLGVRTREGWLGFAEVWREAAALNRLVVDALTEVGLPALVFSASASVTAQDGQVATWNIAPLQTALQEGLLPVVYGDVVFDTVRGGTILSTEDLLSYLAHQLKPTRLLLAGREAGVWSDFPFNTKLVKEITPSNWGDVYPALSGSNATDVTGGMASKVQLSLELVQRVPGLQVMIFSGETPGLLERALLGERLGTSIHA